MKSNEVYVARIPSRRATSYCLCPAYVCETEFESVLVAHRTVFGWRRFTYFIDPEVGLDGNRSDSRRIDSASSKEMCIKKAAGEDLEIILKPDDRSNILWLGIL